MNLLLFIIIPLVTAVAGLLSRSKQQIRWIAFAGSVAQLILAFALLFAFRNERAAGNTSQMIFEQSFSIFPSWHINFHLGVEGISVAMTTPAYSIVGQYPEYYLPSVVGHIETLSNLDDTTEQSGATPRGSFC